MADTETVTVKVVKAFSVYWPGMVAGFEPDQARNLITKGFAVAVSFDDDGNEIAAPAKPEAEPEAPSKEAATPDAAGSVDIPADWENLHHMKQIAIAKQITGADRLTLDQAREAITQELARRAG
ncbi:hypothetical protein [Prosthecomicrobium hirschii]|uniref:hypothetical protein n=1 Tax=Prosthecodimorpha hirschii TaxID=665126 RepID=UPI00221F7C5B|nr:hypothetical protein [Prosthecomicrobium hirschii]MCW1844130.1 hypothetical protein [Prosthecomicrobium hirschii]